MAFDHREWILFGGLSVSDACLSVGRQVGGRLVRWEAACAAVAKLKAQGFFCVRGVSADEQPDFFWCLLTFCYGRGIFGSERIVELVREECWVSSGEAAGCLLAHDLRRFRRNNRKVLTLSLEEFFKSLLCLEGDGVSTGRISAIRELAEQRVLSAIRWDVGELDV